MFKFLSGAALGLTAGTAIGAYVVVSKAVRSEMFVPFAKDLISERTQLFLFGERRPRDRYNGHWYPRARYGPGGRLYAPRPGEDYVGRAHI